MLELESTRDLAEKIDKKKDHRGHREAELEAEVTALREEVILMTKEREVGKREARRSERLNFLKTEAASKRGLQGSKLILSERKTLAGLESGDKKAADYWLSPPRRVHELGRSHEVSRDVTRHGRNGLEAALESPTHEKAENIARDLLETADVCIQTGRLTLSKLKALRHHPEFEHFISWLGLDGLGNKSPYFRFLNEDDLHGQIALDELVGGIQDWLRDSHNHVVAGKNALRESRESREQAMEFRRDLRDMEAYSQQRPSSGRRSPLSESLQERAISLMRSRGAY